MIYANREKTQLRVRIGSVQNNNNGFNTPDATFNFITLHAASNLDVKVDNRALMARSTRFYTVDGASELYRHHCNFVQNFDAQSGNTLHPLPNVAS